MPRRIEIELTSRTGDGVFTWRAAGAKQPKGTVAADLVPEGVGIGDVVRAEVESGLEGVEIVAVLPRHDKTEERPANRIELLGSERRGPDVVVSYAGGRPHREDAARGAGRAPRGSRPPSGAVRAPREGRARREHPEEGGTHAGARPERRRAPAGAEGHAERRRARAGAEGHAERRRERRPAISTVHRNAMLAHLGPQELPIAEQLLRGGIPAVRQALEEQHAARPGDAAAAANRDAVLALAEQLVPRVNLAAWKDRAASAQALGKEFRLRELRAVVTAARAVTLDDEARAMARALQESLDQRVRVLSEEWVGRVAKALDEGRVVDAVRAAARPPEPSTRLPAELAVRLAEAASEAMTAETPLTQWMALLEAVVESPVRRNVRPRGIPADERAKDAARRAAGLVPELAKLLGLRIPPPPPRRPTPRGPRLMAAGGAGPAGAR
jgi:hypothetical protein